MFGYAQTRQLIPEGKQVTELKPCPFCGGKASIFQEWHYYSGDFEYDHVGCCVSFQGGEVDNSGRDKETADAIKEWNTRTTNRRPKDEGKNDL